MYLIIELFNIPIQKRECIMGCYIYNGTSLVPSLSMSYNIH